MFVKSKLGRKREYWSKEAKIWGAHADPHPLPGMQNGRAGQLSQDLTVLSDTGRGQGLPQMTAMAALPRSMSFQGPGNSKEHKRCF